MAKKIAVVLFNMGGPDKLSAVKPFLFNLFNDKAIIGLPNPFRFLLAKLISSKREEEAKKIYEQMGGGSPIVPETRNQAAELEKKLNEESEQDSNPASSVAEGVRSIAEDSSPEQGHKKEDEKEYKTFVAMRYWHPFASEEMKDVETFNPDEMILLPLYPQFSTTTSESSIKDWKKALQKAGLDIPLKTICCYPLEEDFIKAHVNKIKQCLPENLKNVRVLFSAHGLPKKIIENGDPYQWQVEQTAEAIAAELNIENLDWRVCYQSKVGPLEWIGPATDSEIMQAAAENISLVIVPIAFVSEHSETLVELDIQYRDLAKENGLTNYFRVPTLSIDEDFINSLANICKSVTDKSSIEGCSSVGGKKICQDSFKRCIYKK